MLWMHEMSQEEQVHHLRAQVLPLTLLVPKTIPESHTCQAGLLLLNYTPDPGGLS